MDQAEFNNFESGAGLVNRTGWKIIFVVNFMVFVTIGFWGCKVFYPKDPPGNINRLLPKNTETSIPKGEKVHPYGRPFEGVLLWENNRNFHEICAKHQISVRMAAFQTTLPDPLPGEEYNVGLAADLLAGTVVKPGMIFSMNGTLGPYGKAQGFREGPAYYGTQVMKTIGGGVCKIASTLYNVIILANLPVIERHQHGMPVPYVPVGQDATVSSGAKDLKFKNNKDHPILIWADTEKNTLSIAIYGLTKPPKIIWHHQILNRQKFRTIYRYNHHLKPGEEKVVIPGADGLTVKSWLTIIHPNRLTVKKELGIDYYKPLLQVIERGMKYK
jgi:hypothetical protein